MQEQINQKLSQFIDDELDAAQSLELLAAIREDDALQEKLRRYQIASQILKSNEYSAVNRDFADKIHQQLRQEPIYFMPRPKTNPVNWQKAGLAVAASIVLAVVWLASKVEPRQSNPFNSVGVVAHSGTSADYMHARFKDYLQAHDNTLYVNTVQAAQPYARVVGYPQE
ncbi:sigma-E factor negative regulatory protein [Methylomonas koyamae]|uniref:Anti sigma-E protein RseA N-terminal domain-containing protein n=1 Tax=Methylomonas koyamae TaxID=702114 RepID=A0A291IJF3_9GAMM|nr:sigma-E factor negative regulatory protein [Methylomonas koyamae]ATG90326.1 hypothetical protein MKLM6_2098 [Methylomonas koyamae]OAI26643.1 hypothetical protein A1356_00465 [Methylomonas koyamae]